MREQDSRTAMLIGDGALEKLKSAYGKNRPDFSD